MWGEGILGTQQSHSWDLADDWGFESYVFSQKPEEREAVPTRSPSRGEHQELCSVLWTSGSEEEQVRPFPTPFRGPHCGSLIAWCQDNTNSYNKKGRY